MECANASMNIGARIKRTDIQKLIDAILDDGAGFDWIDHSLSNEDILQEIERVAKSKTHLTINANEQPWGRLEHVEGVCRDLGLTYLAEFERGGEWSPGCVFWQPDFSAPGCRWEKLRDLGHRRNPEIKSHQSGTGRFDGRAGFIIYADLIDWAELAGVNLRLEQLHLIDVFCQRCLHVDPGRVI
jgi:hypothetical protein